MTHLKSPHATGQLGNIGSLGYTVIALAQTGQPLVLASTHSPQWTDDKIANWQSNDDTVLEWMSSDLGTKTSRDFEDSPLAKECAGQGPTTFISDLHEGTRLGIALSHTADELTEAEISDAKAAALVLQIELATPADYGVTAKELVYLQLASTGATDDEIAEELQLSLRAVKERKRKAIDDLHANNIGHAVGIAKRAKLI